MGLSSLFSQWFYSFLSGNHLLTVQWGAYNLWRVLITCDAGLVANATQKIGGKEKRRSCFADSVIFNNRQR